MTNKKIKAELALKNGLFYGQTQQRRVNGLCRKKID